MRAQCYKADKFVFIQFAGFVSGDGVLRTWMERKCLHFCAFGALSLLLAPFWYYPLLDYYGRRSRPTTKDIPLQSVTQKFSPSHRGLTLANAHRGRSVRSVQSESWKMSPHRPPQLTL